MKTCAEFELLLASDDPADLTRAREHALACTACRPLFDAQQRLARSLDAWNPAVTPPPALEERVRGAVWERLADGESQESGRWWLAAAAAVLIAALGVWIGLRPGTAPTEASGLLVADALAAAKSAELEHARAIAVLEEAAVERLARADDPAVPASEAALLLAYRDRIASLESTIEEVRAFLHDNPAHPEARTVLLAAYRDKTEVLREVLALGEKT